MAISGGKIVNGALSRWRLGIKWVLKHILILKFSYINISLGIFFVFTTLRYSQRQKSFIPKFFSSSHSFIDKMTIAQRKIFFQKITIFLALWHSLRFATPFRLAKRHDISLSLSLYIYNQLSK